MPSEDLCLPPASSGFCLEQTWKKEHNYVLFFLKNTRVEMK